MGNTEVIVQSNKTVGRLLRITVRSLISKRGLRKPQGVANAEETSRFSLGGWPSLHWILLFCVCYETGTKTSSSLDLIH